MLQPSTFPRDETTLSSANQSPPGFAADSTPARTGSRNIPHGIISPAYTVAPHASPPSRWSPSLSPTSQFSRSTSPCSSCRLSMSPCILLEHNNSCISCQVTGLECSLLRSGLRKGAIKANSPRTAYADLFDELAPGRGWTNNAASPSTMAESPSFPEDLLNIGGPLQLSRTLGLQDDRYSQYIGSTTDFEPSLINLSPFDPQDESLLARGTIRRVSDHDVFLLLPDSDTPGHQHQVGNCDRIESIVAPHGRRLLDLYFQIVHPAFPIIQKNVFLDAYEISHREFSPPLLAAVYILAINWWEQCQDLAHLPRPDLAALETLMRSTLADAMYRPKLSTVQAGLLLSQRPGGDQWAPTAQLVAISQELGLHLDCSSWKIPWWEKSLRKRLAWGLYMQDKWGALVHGRPSHIGSSNWAVKALNARDFPDIEWVESGDQSQRTVIDRGRLVFFYMVRLTAIVAEILDTFYTLSAANIITDAADRGTQLVLSLAKPIQLKLKDWFGSLPADIRVENSYNSSLPSRHATSSSTSSSTAGSLGDDDPSRFPSVGYLHLAYFAAEITLHRRIIRSFDSVPKGADPYLQHICRSAAKARLIMAMDFINRLTPGHLRAFWYFASKTSFALIGTFGSHLWATSPTHEEAEWYRRRLGEYRWTLSVSSKPDERSSLTGFAVTMLDISTGLLKKLPEKPLLSGSASSVDMTLPQPEPPPRT